MTDAKLEQYKFYLSLLKLPAGVSAEQVEARFRALAHRHHPDHNPGSITANHTFRALLEARHFLRTNALAGQAWSRSRSGLEWEWNRAPYQPNQSQNRQDKKPRWESIRPQTNAPADLAADAPARQALRPFVLRAGAVALILIVFSVSLSFYKPRHRVKSVGEFGKKIEIPVAKAKAKPASPDRKRTKRTARKTIARSWPRVAHCLSAMPAKRSYKGEVTYRLKIENRLAAKVSVVEDSLGFPLAHQCVKRVLLATDFGAVEEDIILDFTSAFELGAERMAGR